MTGGKCVFVLALFVFLYIGSASSKASPGWVGYGGRKPPNVVYENTGYGGRKAPPTTHKPTTHKATTAKPTKAKPVTSKPTTSAPAATTAKPSPPAVTHKPSPPPTTAKPSHVTHKPSPSATTAKPSHVTHKPRQSATTAASGGITVVIGKGTTAKPATHKPGHHSSGNYGYGEGSSSYAGRGTPKKSGKGSESGYWMMIVHEMMSVMDAIDYGVQYSVWCLKEGGYMTWTAMDASVRYPTNLVISMTYKACDEFSMAKNAVYRMIWGSSGSGSGSISISGSGSASGSHSSGTMSGGSASSSGGGKGSSHSSGKHGHCSWMSMTYRHNCVSGWIQEPIDFTYVVCGSVYSMVKSSLSFSYIATESAVSASVSAAELPMEAAEYSVTLPISMAEKIGGGLSSAWSEVCSWYVMAETGAESMISGIGNYVGLKVYIKS